MQLTLPIFTLFWPFALWIQKWLTPHMYKFPNLGLIFLYWQWSLSSLNDLVHEILSWGMWKYFLKESLWWKKAEGMECLVEAGNWRMLSVISRKIMGKNILGRKRPCMPWLALSVTKGRVTKIPGFCLMSSLLYAILRSYSVCISKLLHAVHSIHPSSCTQQYPKSRIHYRFI